MLTLFFFLLKNKGITKNYTDTLIFFTLKFIIILKNRDMLMTREKLVEIKRFYRGF